MLIRYPPNFRISYHSQLLPAQSTLESSKNRKSLFLANEDSFQLARGQTRASGVWDNSGHINRGFEIAIKYSSIYPGSYEDPITARDPDRNFRGEGKRKRIPCRALRANIRTHESSEDRSNQFSHYACLSDSFVRSKDEFTNIHFLGL